MRRISAIRTEKEADLEGLREDLRERRWARRRSMLLTAAGVVSAGAATAGGGRAVVHGVRQVLGL
jgi:hypothetical protein